MPRVTALAINATRPLQAASMWDSGCASYPDHSCDSACKSAVSPGATQVESGTRPFDRPTYRPHRDVERLL
jgi:hypothetical protein